MKYKKSFYNIEVAKLADDRKLVYNAFTGIFGIMDKSTQALYECIENIETKDLQDAENIKTIDIMARSGYIIDADKDELATKN